MTRSLCLTLICAAMLLVFCDSPLIRAQTPAPPEPPLPAESELAEPSPPQEADAPVVITRHRMGIEVYRLEKLDSLEAAIAKMRAKLDEIDEEGHEAEAVALENRIKRMESELALLLAGLELSELKDLKLPGVVIPKIDIPEFRLEVDGEKHIITLDPRKWRRKRGDQIGVFENVYVDPNEWIEASAVAIFGNVHVSGHVDEQVVAIGGDAYINGTVDGDVVAPFGHIYLGENARVEGDLVAVESFVSEQAFLGGTIEDVTLPRIPWVSGDGVGSLFALLTALAISTAVIAVLLGFLALAVTPVNVGRVEDRLRLSPVGSFLAGLAIEILAFPVWLLLVVTVIGIPVALLAMPLLLAAAKILGFVAFAVILGRALLKQKRGSAQNWLPFILGALILHAPLVIGLGLRASARHSAPAPVALVANLLLFLGLCLLYLSTTAGLGAALMSRLGTRDPQKRAEARPTPSGAGMPPSPKLGGSATMPSPPPPAGAT